MHDARRDFQWTVNPEYLKLTTDVTDHQVLSSTNPLYVILTTGFDIYVNFTKILIIINYSMQGCC